MGTEEGKNKLLTMAGLFPLQPEELDLDRLLDNLAARWRKTHFLHDVMRWDERRIGDKLGIAFWEVKQDLEEAKMRKEVEAERGRLLEEFRHLDPRWQRHFGEVQSLAELFTREMKLVFNPARTLMERHFVAAGFPSRTMPYPPEELRGHLPGLLQAYDQWREVTNHGENLARHLYSQILKGVEEQVSALFQHSPGLRVKVIQEMALSVYQYGISYAGKKIEARDFEQMDFVVVARGTLFYLRHDQAGKGTMLALGSGEAELRECQKIHHELVRQYSACQEASGLSSAIRKGEELWALMFSEIEKGPDFDRRCPRCPG